MLENFIILNNLDANQKTNNININPVNKKPCITPARHSPLFNQKFL